MKTLKELLEGATPGPWLQDDSLVYALQDAGFRHGERRFENRFSASVQGSRIRKEEVSANAELIARCNPATMRLVLEALTLAKQLVDGPLDCPPRPSAVHKAVVSALAALNGASHGEQGEGR